MIVEQEWSLGLLDVGIQEHGEIRQLLKDRWVVRGNFVALMLHLPYTPLQVCHDD